MKEKKLNQLKEILLKAKATSDLYEILPFLDEESFSSKMFENRIVDYRASFSYEDFNILNSLNDYYHRFYWFFVEGKKVLNSTEEDILKDDDLLYFSEKIRDLELLNSHNILKKEEQEKFQKLKELYKKVDNKYKQKRQEEMHKANFVFLKEILDFFKIAKSDEELIEFIQRKMGLRNTLNLTELYHMLKECKSDFTSEEIQDLLYGVLYIYERYINLKKTIVETLLSFDKNEDAVNYIFNRGKYKNFVESYKSLNLSILSEKEIKKLEDIKSLSEKVINKLKSKETLIQIIEMTKSDDYTFGKLIKYMLRRGLKPNLLEVIIVECNQDLSNEQILILRNISKNFKRFLSYKGYYFKDVLDMRKNNCSNEFIANYLVDNNFSYADFNRSLYKLSRKKISEEEANVLLEFSKFYSSKYYELNERKKMKLKKEKHRADIVKAKKVVSEYILTKEKNCSNFDYYVKLLKDIDDPLYAEYQLVAKSNSAQTYAIIIKNGKDIINLMINGIQLENGNTRKFDVIDYFSRTSLKTDEFLKIMKGKLSSQEYNVFQRFVRANKFYPIDTNKLYSTFQAYNVQFDKSNNAIPGTGRVIEQYEKENIINYIKEHHLPFTQNVYNALFDRWKNGYLQMPTKFNQDNNYSDSDVATSIKNSNSNPDYPSSGEGGRGSM